MEALEKLWSVFDIGSVEVVVAGARLVWSALV